MNQPKSTIASDLSDVIASTSDPALTALMNDCHEKFMILLNSDDERLVRATEAAGRLAVIARRRRENRTKVSA